MEPQIKIPRANEDEVVRVPSGEFGKFGKKLDRLNSLLLGIVSAVVISGIAVVVAVVGIFLDQLRYNNAAYKEYTVRNELLVQLRDANNILLEENKTNKIIIIDQQGQILRLNEGKK